MRILNLHRENERRLGGRGGQAAIIATLTLTFMFASLGLAWDLGWDYFLKSRVQTAADAGATAAAEYALNAGDSCSTIMCGVAYTCAGVTPTTSLQAGCLYATSDGPPAFAATMIEGDSSSLPPGLGSSPTMWFKATVTTTNNNYFLYLSGFHSSAILASAIAGTRTIPAGSCIYVLSPTASRALTITGTSSITTSSCGTSINSNASDALYLNGSPYLGATGGGQIRVNGGDSISVGGHALPDPSPAPLLHNGPVSDPLGNLPAYSYSPTCDAAHTNYSLDHSHTGTLSAGVYCGGISVTGNASLTLGQGIYVLNGGGLTVANSASVSGTNVMFYNTASSGQVAGPVSITGNGTVSLTAPNSGTYQGIAFYQDRHVTYAGANTISNSGSGTISGTYYFPTTAFNFTGNTATALNSAFIAATMTLAGSCTLQSDTTGTLTGLARPTAGMLQ
jgi:Putative Flp pilus-assembly TadE/G-like